MKILKARFMTITAMVKTNANWFFSLFFYPVSSQECRYHYNDAGNKRNKQHNGVDDVGVEILLDSAVASF